VLHGGREVLLRVPLRKAIARTSHAYMESLTEHQQQLVAAALVACIAARARESIVLSHTIQKAVKT
jgi:hypothetical protein